MCLVFDMKQLTIGGAGGDGGEAPNGLSCQKIVSDHTTWIRRGSIVLDFAPLIFSFSVPRFSPSIPHAPLALDMQAGWAHGG